MKPETKQEKIERLNKELEEARLEENRTAKKLIEAENKVSLCKKEYDFAQEQRRWIVTQLNYLEG